MWKLGDILVLFVGSFAHLKMHSNFISQNTIGIVLESWTFESPCLVYPKRIKSYSWNLINCHLHLISGFIDEEVKSRVLTIGKSEFQCTECGHITTKKTNLLRHIESKHMVLEAIACKFCGKMCPSKNALSSHVSRYHRFQQE